MSLYKLLKDTPTIKAGTIFREVVSDYDGARELARVTPIGAKTNPQWTIQDINNFDEWFEEIQEPVRYETKEEAEKSIRENEQDWKIYFGIKEEE